LPLQGVRDLLLIEDDHGVEVRECHDQQEVDDLIPDVVRAEEPLEVAPDLAHPVTIRACQEVSDQSGHDHDAHREDQRDHAGGVHLQGNEGGVATILLVPADALGVMDRDPALTLVDVHDADYSAQRDKRKEHGADQVICGRATRKEAPNSLGQAGDDTAEDDDRDAVADAVFGNQLTHPDEKHGAGRHGQQQRCAGEEGVTMEETEI
jgi:hypothetical protein